MVGKFCPEEILDDAKVIENGKILEILDDAKVVDNGDNGKILDDAKVVDNGMGRCNRVVGRCYLVVV